jgi:hypothetical protein
VVCEGYAKAFKYLCDLTDFDKEIYCYLISGVLSVSGSSEGHMWNVLVMDGVNYLVDVTNYDGNPSSRSYLFLGGATSYNGGEKHLVKNEYSYTYAENQKNLFCEGYLVLASSAYHEHRYSSNWYSSGSQHWHQCSCGDKTDVADHTPSSVGSCLQRSTCEICGVKYGSFLSHNYNQKVIDSGHLRSVATCTAKATYYYGCTCGAIGSTYFEYGETLPHEFTQKKITDDYLANVANCVSGATYYFSCKCGAKSESTFEYGSAGTHSYDRQITELKYLVSEATCTKAAVYLYSCVCGKTDTATFEYGEALEHDYLNGECRVCKSPEENKPPIDNEDTNSDVIPEYGDTNCIQPKSFIEIFIEAIIGIIIAILKALFGIE